MKLNRVFSKEERETCNEHFFLKQANREMQIKSTLRFTLTPVEMAIVKNSNLNKSW